MWFSSSSIFPGVGPLVDPFWSHASRSLFNGLPWFLLPVGKYCFMILGKYVIFCDIIQNADMLLHSLNCIKQNSNGTCKTLFFKCIFHWSPRPKKARMQKIKLKMMLICSLTKRGSYTWNLSHLEWRSVETSIVMF